MVTLTWPLTCDLGDWRFFLQRSAFAVSIVKSSSCRGSLVRIFQVRFACTTAPSTDMARHTVMSSMILHLHCKAGDYLPTFGVVFLISSTSHV